MTTTETRAKARGLSPEVNVKDTEQLSLIPETRPEPVWEGRMELAALLDRLDVRWFDHGGTLVLKIVSKAFTESVRKFGILHPVILTEHPDEVQTFYRIAAGRGRIQAAIDAGLETVPVRLYNGMDVSTHQITVIENTHRGENIVAEYEAIFQIIEEARSAGQSITEKQLCDALNLNIQALRKLMRLGNLDLRLLDALRDGKISQTVAEQAAKLAPEYQQKLIPILEDKGTFTGDDVRNTKSVQNNAAAALIPASVFGTPAADPVPVAPAGPRQVFVVVSVRLDTEKWMGVHGAFFEEQDAIQEATRLAGKSAQSTYNYIVTPTTLE